MSAIIAATNAVVVALLLPRIAEFAKKLDLPETNCTLADVRQFIPMSSLNELAGCVKFKDRNTYLFGFDYVQSFETDHTYYQLQYPAPFTNFYGPLNMTKAEAIELARSTIRRLGYTEEMLYADLEPEVLMPPQLGTSIIPHFQITWPAPNRDAASVQIEVNGAAKRIERIWLLNGNLERQPRALPGSAPARKRGPPEVPADEARRMLPKLLPHVTEFAKALRLPVAMPVTTNQVGSSTFQRFGDGIADGTIKLTNGFTFTVMGQVVHGFAAPDQFFGWQEVKVRDFTGKWNITEAQAIDLAREAIISLGVPRRVVAGPPGRIERPYGAAKNLVPRCFLVWDSDQKELACAMVEVDGATGTVKSLTLL